MNMTYSSAGGYDCYLGHANFIAWNNHREGVITSGKIGYTDTSNHPYMDNNEKWQFYRIDINSSMSVFYVNNTQMGVFSGDTTMNSIGGYKGGGYGICTIDFIKVRHQVIPEPSYAFGEEETTTTTLPYGSCDLCCIGNGWDYGECYDSPTCFGLNGSLDDCAEPYCQQDYCCCLLTTTTTTPVTTTESTTTESTTTESTTTIYIYPENCPNGCSQIPIYPYGFESCTLCIGNVTQLTNNCTLVCAPEDICSPNLYCLEFEQEFYCGCCCKNPLETTTTTSTSTTTTYPPFMNITSFPSCCMVSRSYCIDNETVRQVWVVNNQSIQADAFCDNGCDTVLNECRKPQITEFIYYFLALVIIAVIIGIIMYLFRRF
jgi:predicted nucleic acid-binding Zn ribbon protein